MSRAVWKFAIPVDDQWHEINMPTPVRVVHVACTEGFETVYLWAEVSTDSSETATRKMRVFGTGHALPDSAAYVGTAPAEPFVWHVYAEVAQ